MCAGVCVKGGGGEAAHLCAHMDGSFTVSCTSPTAASLDSTSHRPSLATMRAVSPRPSASSVTSGSAITPTPFRSPSPIDLQATTRDRSEIGIIFVSQGRLEIRRLSRMGGLHALSAPMTASNTAADSTPYAQCKSMGGTCTQWPLPANGIVSANVKSCQRRGAAAAGKGAVAGGSAGRVPGVPGCPRVSPPGDLEPRCPDAPGPLVANHPGPGRHHSPPLPLVVRRVLAVHLHRPAVVAQDGAAVPGVAHHQTVPRRQDGDGGAPCKLLLACTMERSTWEDCHHVPAGRITWLSGTNHMS